MTPIKPDIGRRKLDRRGRPSGTGERWESGDLKPPRKDGRGRPPGIPRPMVLPEPPTPEERLGMSRADAQAAIGPLLPEWSVYASAPPGEVADAPTILRAAMLLYELGLAIIAQRRRYDGGTDYVIRRRKGA